MKEYGLITPTDAETITLTLERACKFFPDGVINTTELGVRDGRTSRGIHGYLTEKNRINFHTGIDNNHDLNTQVPFVGCHLIIGNSMEVYNQLQDNSQHFIFIDSCHNLPMTMIDFLMYGGKVKVNGYLAFHDCSPHIPPFKDYQGMGDKSDPDFYIACRKAVTKLGLLDDLNPGWRLVYDEFDPSFDTGGVIVVRKNR